MSIAKQEVEFLGIIWRKGMLHIPTARISAFKNMPIPKTPKKVKSFVSTLSYYRRFIPKIAELAKPLMDLSTLHPSQFKWQNLHQKAFESMIDALQNNTSLNLPYPSKPFFVQTDASDIAGARRVFQKDDQGNELLMACVYRTLTRAERKYGTFRKEVLALLYCLKSMDFFLRFASKLIIFIDAKSILFYVFLKKAKEFF